MRMNLPTMIDVVLAVLIGAVTLHAQEAGPILNKADLNRLLKHAQTAQDFDRLAKHFAAKAQVGAEAQGQKQTNTMTAMTMKGMMQGMKYSGGAANERCPSMEKTPEKTPAASEEQHSEHHAAPPETK